uniref:MAPEG family protein n=1 Tax=Tetradesmus obliquus TaxID=3088 RepID=A0A383VLI4_TETOB|eukprot:jgi/Sobl393_1/4132/SZX66397.1
MVVSREQFGVVRGVAVAAAVLLGVTAYCLTQQAAYEPKDRLMLWLKWNAPKAACLWWHIWRIGNYRFSSPTDIMGAGLSTNPTPQIKLMQAMLQNTLEQTVLAALVHGAFAALAPPQWLVLVPAYTLLFVAGRVLFVALYQHGAPARAPGFALTSLPTTVMLLGSCWLLLKDPW